MAANQFQVATYLQSDWRAQSNLTLSFGVRYENQTNLSDHNNIDPRFGFAYNTDGRAVIRGGYGISYIHFHRAGAANILAILPREPRAA